MRVDEELKTYLQVLWRYKWMIVACAVIAMTVALAISAILTPMYSATATLRVASAPGGVTDYSYGYSTTRLSNTYVEIAESDMSLDEVAKRLGLQKRPNIEVKIVPETELIKITTSDPDPARSRDIANTLANFMIEQSVQLFGGNAPTAREMLESQLAQAKDDLNAAVSVYDAALRNSAPLPNPTAAETPKASAELGMLERLVSVRQQIYGDLLQRYENARINEQVRANSITIVEPAGLALRPSSPNMLLNLGLGLVGGLVLGVILAFLFEGMDDTVRGIEDVQAMSSLPILCQVPEKKRTLASTINLSPSKNGHLQPLPAIHLLRTRLLLSEANPKSTSFLITSPEPGAGKSTIAANLAISIAETGCRVVLVDLDLYRPRLQTIFNLPDGQGLSDYICGNIEIDAVLRDTLYPNLRIATAGSYADVPSEWLSPVKIRGLLERLSKSADYLLVDAPALLSVADPSALASQADAVILVVARRGTERKQLRFALQQLGDLNARIVGVVVNKMPSSRAYNYYRERSSKKAKPVPGEAEDSVEVDVRN